MTTPVSEKILLRPADKNDGEFIYGLFRKSCIEKLNAHLWSDKTINPIVDIQYKSHEAHHRDKSHSLILMDGEKCGRLIYLETERKFHISDIFISLEFRCLGIGSLVLKDLIRETHKKGKEIELYVDMNNFRAVSLYKKLGFVEKDRSGFHLLMKLAKSNKAEEKGGDLDE